MALPLLSVSGNNCAYDFVSIGVVIIPERSSMIVPKENSGNKKKVDTNVIISLMLFLSEELCVFADE